MPQRETAPPLAVPLPDIRRHASLRSAVALTMLALAPPLATAWMAGCAWGAYRLVLILLA
ncbi:hypothetical protein [Methylobacterium sp. JK268]